MSTHTAMHSFYARLLEHLEAGECPVGIFCDLSRAFDCVNHERLLNKLNAYGIRGVSLGWITSFLSDRLQYVNLTCLKNNNIVTVNSERGRIEMGVPQGSILGPILFLFYVNELDSFVKDASLIMYADDQSLIVSDATDSILEQKCRNVLEIIGKWFNHNNLYFNKGKTQVVRFHNRQKNAKALNIGLSGSDGISFSPEVKFLGITMDECLGWRPHCTEVISRLNSLCFLMRSLRTILSREQLLMVYHAQVSSRLRYGICFWGRSRGALDVFVAQKRIVRCLAGVCSIFSCRSLFKEYNILTVTNVLIYEMCVYVFMNKTDFILNKNVHKQETRQKDNFYVPFCLYNVTGNSPGHLGLKIFNLLPPDVKSAASVAVFKKRLRQYLLDNVYYNLDEYYKTM